MEAKSEAEEICKNSLYILKEKNSKIMKLIHIHNIIKKNNIKIKKNKIFIIFLSILKILNIANIPIVENINKKPPAINSEPKIPV